MGHKRAGNGDLMQKRDLVRSSSMQIGAIVSGQKGCQSERLTAIYIYIWFVSMTNCTCCCLVYLSDIGLSSSFLHCMC